MKNVLYSRIVGRHLRDEDGDPAVQVTITEETNFVMAAITDCMVGPLLLKLFRPGARNEAIDWLFSKAGSDAINTAINHFTKARG